jgi:hypothetical protein
MARAPSEGKRSGGGSLPTADLAVHVVARERGGDRLL